MDEHEPMSKLIKNRFKEMMEEKNIQNGPSHLVANTSYMSDIRKMNKQGSDA